MKTLEEFIQRLQDDAAFEKQAQSFNHGDDLMAFVKREGYDFTLEQLMSEFGPGEKLSAETGGMPPAVRAAIERICRKPIRRQIRRRCRIRRESTPSFC